MKEVKGTIEDIARAFKNKKGVLVITNTGRYYKGIFMPGKETKLEVLVPSRNRKRLGKHEFTYKTLAEFLAEGTIKDVKLNGDSFTAKAEKLNEPAIKALCFVAFAAPEVQEFTTSEDKPDDLKKDYLLLTYTKYAYSVTYKGFKREDISAMDEFVKTPKKESFRALVL